LTLVRALGYVVRERRLLVFEHEGVAGAHGDLRMNHFVALATDDGREAWSQVVSGGGDEVGLVFHCRFAPLDASPALRPPQGAFLHLL
jgi:hypothetical protein